MLYSISNHHVQVQEIKISPAIMLLLFNRAIIANHHDETVLKAFNHLLHQKKVDFIEQFHEKCLVKQANEYLQILDVQHMELPEISRTEFMTLSAFTHIFSLQFFCLWLWTLISLLTYLRLADKPLFKKGGMLGPFTSGPIDRSP
ncbi:hypothetical protein L3X38_017032 [Prunus dulcis]|uniref:Uncharacterized protein n=1 Tax=Prunus dulcis TaxID=3755 RepID=A0AAD4Z9N9_PRUDU|nr:hypothetical protein L3X38_017032 [Prunus dulcis]